MRKFSIYAFLIGLNVNAIKLTGVNDNDMIPAATNKDIPPFTTTAAVTAMAGKSLFEQTAKASGVKGAWTPKGEKNW